MADADDVAAQPVEPAAERDVELVEAELAHLVCVIALRQLHRGNRIGLRARVDGEDFPSVVLAPGAHRAPRRLGDAMMPCEDLVEALLLEHSQRLLQPIEQGYRRGA